MESSSSISKTGSFFSKRIVSVAIATAVCAIAVTAEKSRAEMIEEVVVTGTAGGGELRKLDASFAITNVSSEDIIKFSPKSTADLLKSIPGVWAESSGGVSGANVFVRGFPATGDAPFYTLEVEGAPIFPPATLSFLENSTLFRIDETIERVEGLRGGTQPVQDNGQPGLTTNFLLKRGGPESEGLVKYSTSDYDLQRIDAVASGEISSGFYYMIGGYVSSSPGIRDAGYSAEKGHQFTINLTKELEKGTIDVYHRVTDDHGTWYLPGALNVPGVDSSYTQVGTLNRQGTVQYGPEGTILAVDQGDGRGWDGSVSGVSFDLEINDIWSLSDSMNITKGDANTVGLVPEGGAVNVGALLANPDADPSAEVTGALTGSATGRAIGSSEYIQQFGNWVVLKDIESFSNNLALTGAYEKFDVVVGYYTATSSVDEFWTLGNQKYYVVEQGGELVDGIACNDISVDSCTWNYDIDAKGDITNNAFYTAVTYRATDALSLDVGVRRESHEVEYSVDEGLTGSISKSVQYDESKTSFTVGGNLALTENTGLFARYSEGFKFPYFDDFRDNFGTYQGGEDLIKEVTQYEIGYKASLENISAYLTLFGNEIIGDTFVPRPNAPVEKFNNEALGLEIDVKWYHESGFTLGVNGTIQNTEITKGTPDILDAAGNVVTKGTQGNEAQRQPPYQLRLSPSYDLELGKGMSATLYGALTFVDDRYADNQNTVVLDGYEKLDLGVILNASENLTLQVAADNVTDEDALTEGDPRNAGAPNGRYIMPRNFKFSVGYTF